MGKLATHSVNTADAVPGVGIASSLCRMGRARVKPLETTSKHEGRCEQPRWHQQFGQNFVEVSGTALEVKLPREVSAK